MPFSYVEACKRGAWHLTVWDRTADNPEVSRIPFACRSWRHEGDCRLWCGACDYTRIHEAILSGSHWTYLVLTYPRKKYPNLDKLFRLGVIHWSRLRKRLSRRFGEIRYIQTWEIHKDEYPHVNVLISNQGLYDEATTNHRAFKRKWLEPVLVETGWGPISWLEAMRSSQRMAGYLTKLAREMTGAHGKSQVPINAPRNFRRIRASVRLLPPRKKNPDLTGILHKYPLPGGEIVINNDSRKKID